MLPHTLEGEYLRRQCKKSYLEYCATVNDGFVKTRFSKYICSKVQEFLEAPCTRALDILLLSVPPRHGKSYMLSETLPSWFLARYPNKECIIAGYEGTFAESFSRRNRDKFNQFAPDIFGVGPNKNVQGVALWETEKGGRCHAAGLKGGITGYGADLFIIDDPIKNQESAESESTLSRLHDEMGPSVQSRIYPGGKLIVIQTRWVENDVVGYIKTHWSEYIWEDINLPCECEDPEHDPLGRQLGDSLMGDHLNDPPLPERIKNDNTWLKTKKKLVMAGEGEHVWNALYQGHPSAQDGNLFNTEWWQSYQRTVEPCQGKISWKDFEYTCMSVDATFKKTETSDMVAIELWGLIKDRMYLWSVVNKRMGFVDTCKTIQKYCNDYPDIDNLIIEDKANGSAIIDTLHYYENIPPIIAVNPLGGKFSRAQAVSPYIGTGKVYIPTDFTELEAREVEWDAKESLSVRGKFIAQHTRFPYAAHDDMVDAETQAMARLIKMATGEEPVPNKRITKFVKWYPDMWEDFEQMSDLEQEQFIKTYGAPLEWQNL